MNSDSTLNRLLDRLVRWRLLVAAFAAAVVLALLFVFGVVTGLSLIVAGLVGIVIYLVLTVVSLGRTARELETMIANEQNNVIDMNNALTKAQAHIQEITADLSEEHATNTVLSGQVRAFQARMNALNDRLLALNKQLDILGRTKGEFLARMSHELRTPLNSIVGYTELVLDGMYGELTGQQHDRLDRVLRNGRSLLSMINDILDLAEIDAGHLDLNFAKVDVANALKLAVASCEPRAQAKDLKISLDIEADLLPISADELRLRQMIVNLLDNAVKFTEEGQINVWVRHIYVEDTGEMPYPKLGPGNWLVVSVADTGIGVQSELHEHIFEDFVQADTSATRQYSGSGLGLTVTQRLVHLHGGLIWVESELGEGATFILAIPYDLMDEVEAPETGRAGMVANQPLVLVVDDEEDARDIVGHYLAQAGYRVAHAESGGRALKMAQQLYPDAIILDILMPDMDGWEVLERLHTEPRTTSIPVITVSIMDQQRRARKQGAVAHIPKPVDRETLTNTVGKAVAFGSKPPVLVVDDDRATRNTFTAVLRMAGHQATPVSSAPAAIDWLQNRHASLILLGLDTESDDMHQVIDFVQSQPSGKRIPLVVVAGDNAAVRITPGTRTLVLQRRGLAQQELLASIKRAIEDYE